MIDAARRGAIMRGARLAAGAVAGVATLGRAREMGSLNAAASPAVPYPTDMAAKVAGYGETVGPNPDWIARHEASQPLRMKLEELYGHTGWSISRAHHLVAESSYLPALKSTAHWWQCSVAMDRQKRKATAIQTLEDQISKLMQSPLDKVKEVANEALAEFMAAMQKP